MPQPEIESRAKRAVARAFSVVEDIVYIGLGLLLAGSSIILLGTGIIAFGQSLMSGSFAETVVALLDRILLILLFVELLYTVQISFREHALVPEPFILVGLIAAIRRILVLTAEFAEIVDKPDTVFRHFIIELGALTFLIVTLVFSLFLLRKSGRRTGVEGAA
ncbi:MAG: phosphate-starvation-inducible PsiE family protein [Candidatus Binatia bacterium]